MGILDDVLSFVKTPEGQGLLSGVAGYAAGAQRGAPINSIGRGLYAGVVGYGHAQDQVIQKQQADQMGKLRGMQIDQMSRQLDLNKRLGEALQAGAQPNRNVEMSLAGGGGPTLDNAAKLQSLNASAPAATTLSPAQALAKAAQEAGDYEAYQKAQSMLIEEKKLAPKYATEWRVGVGADGKLTNFAVADDGSFKSVGVGVKPNMKVMDNGGSQVAYDENAIAPGQTWKKTATIGDSLSASRLAFDKAQAALPVFNPEAGGFVVKPSQQNPNGGVIPLAGFSKPLNGEQAKAVGFLERMNAAEKLVSDPKISQGQLPNDIEGIAGSLPGVGDALANFSRDPIRQQYRQAQEDWVRAKLRKESGAAIGKDEMEKEIQQYFPQYGDSPEVIAQKNESRRTAIGALHKETGGSYKMPETAKAASRSVKLDDGTSVIATLGTDGNYYVSRKGKKFRVEE